MAGVIGVWDAGCGWLSEGCRKLWLLVAMVTQQRCDDCGVVFENKTVCLFTMRR